MLPTLLVDGRVVGVWRTTEEGIEASAFEPLSDDAWQGLTAEAEKLLAFLADREPHAYRRYDHWWAKSMPSVEVVQGALAIAESEDLIVAHELLARQRPHGRGQLLAVAPHAERAGQRLPVLG